MKTVELPSAPPGHATSVERDTCQPLTFIIIVLPTFSIIS